MLFCSHIKIYVVSALLRFVVHVLALKIPICSLRVRYCMFVGVAN